MANIFWTKRDINNWAKALRSTRSLIHCQKISCILVHKHVKIRPDLLPTSVNSAFCFIASWRCTERTEPTLCQTGRGKWRWCEVNKVVPHSECKWNHRNWVDCVPGPQKQFKLAMASHWASFSGNTSLIATFSSFITFSIIIFLLYYNIIILCSLLSLWSPYMNEDIHLTAVIIWRFERITIPRSTIPHWSARAGCKHHWLNWVSFILNE